MPKVKRTAYLDKARTKLSLARDRKQSIPQVKPTHKDQGVDWKPIESAPTDGTPVLLYCPGINSWNRKEGMPDIVVGLMEKLCGQVSTDGGRTWHRHGWFSDVGDVDQGYESTGAYFEHEMLRPTHWMPLPAPPSSK